MNLKELISIDPEVLGGQTVFKGTRVPVESMFDHLEAGVSLDSFLEDFPSVSREQAIALLDWSGEMVSGVEPRTTNHPSTPLRIARMWKMFC